MQTLSKKMIADIIKDASGEFPYSTRGNGETKSWVRRLAVKGGSYGPMTCTNAHLDRNAKAKQKIIDTFSFHGVLPVSDTECDNACRTKFDLQFDIRLDDKTVRTVIFTLNLFPTFFGNTYDSGYQTYWYVSSTVDKKVPV